jgi:Ca2+-binding EF-hand superfamily protein
MSNSNLKIIFNKFDKTHSNTLDLDEFNDFLKSYNKETISKDDYDKICAEVEIDSDKKTLNFEELKKVLNHLR